MTYVVVALIAVVAVWPLFGLLRSLSGHVSSADLMELARGFSRLQRQALDNVAEANLPQAEFDQRFAQQVVRGRRGFSIVYTVEREANLLRHIVSVRAPGRRHQVCVQGAVFLLSLLASEFSDSGFGDTVKVEPAESQLGTCYLGFDLTPAQHEALRRVVLSPGASR